MMLVAAWLLFRNRIAELQPATRANAAVRIGGFVLLLAASCGLATLHWSRRRAARDGRRCAGAGRGAGPCRGASSVLGATLLLLAAWMAGAALAFHVSWLDVMDRHRPWLLEGRGLVQGLAGHAPRSRRRAGAQARAPEVVEQDKEKKKATPRVAPVIEQPAPAVEKSERVETGAAGDAVRSAQGRRTAAAEAARRSAGARGGVFGRSARGHVAPGGDQAARISASKSKWWPCIRARWSRASRCSRRPA